MMQEPIPSGAPVYAAREMNGLAIGAFVVALIGLCSPLGILGLILGYVAKSQIKSRNNSGSGLATAAVVLGWISLLAFIGLLIALVAGGMANWTEWRDELKSNL
ncbi:DUF4190 domain-containing protein [Glycomyces sp. TRM65418]|uniref:DUF4190 domain-containing protein n=1 Tax=Glycomyces sp. TRM65418 TaxID=2867006 RepID=UPI001CE6A878|nr:DUF4190 domain-containing protein [Glycomyces sp. TRM65418]MCC3765109.1 DUF4190 domain-containing protein [Glycomyces sp. TRM65418]QZD54738.1 DUF4190 domain-containing protein [Glycomyces sp. TRM65418]